MYSRHTHCLNIIYTYKMATRFIVFPLFVIVLFVLMVSLGVDIPIDVMLYTIAACLIAIGFILITTKYGQLGLGIMGIGFLVVLVAYVAFTLPNK